MIRARRSSLLAIFTLAAAFVPAAAQPQESPLSREQWGAPAVSVTHGAGQWRIAGKKNQVTLNESDLGLTVNAEGVSWKMKPSQADDLLVKSHGETAISATPMRSRR